MASRRRPPSPPPPEIRQFSPEEIEPAIAKLRRRIDELRSLDAATVHHDDPRVDVATNNFRAAVLEVFGPNSPEFRTYEHHRVWRGGMFIGMEDAHMDQAVRGGIKDTIVLVEGLIGSLEERRSDHAADPEQRIRDAFKGLSLHPRIAGASADTFLDGHHREAVLNASIALVNFVKERSGKHDLDGAPLMRTVFSKNNPILAFNSLADQTDADEQEGLMHLFEGAVMALRNPRAHDVIPDDPNDAIEYVSFLSLLAKRLERATKRRP